MLGIHSVNALSGLYLIVTASGSLFIAMLTLCQCPLGLIPHCYSVIYWSLTRDVKCVNALSGLYLIVTLMIRWYQQRTRKDVSMPSRAYTSLLRLALMRFTALSTFVSMPSRAYTSLLHRAHLSQVGSPFFVSMPSRAYTSLLQYPFKNLGFMRFPEPIFAGICQNILIITHFHAC